MSKNYQQNTHKNNFSGVLPDIVANFKTAMCNPYDKRKVITNRSKIPVRKICTNGKSAIRGVVPAPVRAAKQAPLHNSTGHPAGLFDQPAKTGLANFKIPKLNRANGANNNNASSTGQSGNMSRAPVTTQSRIPSVSRKIPSKLTSDKSSRKPTTHVLKLSQPSKRGLHTTTTNPKRNVVKATKSIAGTTAATAKKPQHVQQRKGPWPYGIPPCSRYEIKWGDPAYTGSYVEGEWWYDVVGAAPRPMAWPDMSDMFPDVPKGIFELRSVEPCADPSELSSTEGKPDSHNECQETPHVGDANNVQSRKPASPNAVRDNTSSVTGSSVTMCAEFQGKDVSLAAPYYTHVSAVTETTTVCDQEKATSFHSDGTSVHIKIDSLVKSVTKARDIKRCDNGPYDRNLYKLFSSYPTTDVHKRGIKRAADDCVEPSFVKKMRTERQD